MDGRRRTEGKERGERKRWEGGKGKGGEERTVPIVPVLRKHHCIQCHCTACCSCMPVLVVIWILLSCEVLH